MKFYLIDRNEEMVDMWKKEFHGEDDVKVIQGDFFSEKVDCIVSPANSFGYMDGGLDLVISKRFGWELQGRVQSVIKNHYNGELLVGQAILMDTRDVDIPWCIVAPTMRIPLYVPETLNAYLAARAVFLSLKDFGPSYNINSITMSGFCTGVGAMPFGQAAKQMWMAYSDFWLGKFVYPKTWIEAKHKHALLTGWDYKA